MSPKPFSLSLSFEFVKSTTDIVHEHAMNVSVANNAQYYLISNTSNYE